MGDNILALGSPKPMTATQLGNFLSKNIYALTSFNAKGDKNYLDKMISKLTDMKAASEQAEGRAYKMLGVGSLAELQTELDILNASGLLALSNSALRKMPAIQNTQGSYVHVGDLRKAIEKEFETFLQGRGYQNITEAAYELGSAMIIELFHQFEKDALQVQKGSLLAGLRSGKATKRGEKILGLFFNEIKKDRKKKILAALEITEIGMTNADTNLGFIELTVPNNEGTQVLNYYPYFALSSEQQSDAIKNKQLWEDFVDAVASCVYDSTVQNEVKYVMKNLMGVESFVSTGGSYADIVGILGELQTLTFLYHLGAKQNLAPRFLGHAVNQSGEKVGVDVALGAIGFQVKNYKTYGSAEGGNEGIMLSGNYTLKNFLNLIEPNFAVPGMRWSLEQFYAASAYHVAVHSDFNNMRTWMDNMQKTYLPRLYHGAIAELLPLKQITWIDQNTRSMGHATNAFYIIGGTRILPVSKILSLYIKYLIDFKQNINNPALITMHGNNGGIKYTGGATYRDYYEDPDSYNFPGYSAIADNIYIKYNINMNIDYSLEEVLSKALKI